jgi:hypothetical protein
MNGGWGQQISALQPIRFNWVSKETPSASGGNKTNTLGFLARMAREIPTGLCWSKLVTVCLG